ncbi:MAG: hypothetical protein IJD58_11500 [Lachnospiraceae bacterium]|nr:hypothetical protein [Lachnospiraceae bacterium]
MSEINKAVLLCFKDYDDLFKYRRESMNHLERYCEGFRAGSTMYKLGLMNSSTACGLSADEVFFVNCSIDDCEDEDFKLTLRVLEKWGAKIHYDPKDTEELQSNLERFVSLMKLYEYCASGELRRYRQEVAMQKLNEEFALKQDKNVMEICKGFLEQYENGTLFDETE